MTADDDASATDRSFSGTLKGWLRGGRRPRNGEATVRETLDELIEERVDAETPFSEHERILLANILDLRNRRIEDVMLPRADIIAIEVKAPLAEVIEVMTREGHSRLPVFRDSLDDTIGMVHIRDVLGWPGEKEEFSLARIVRKTLFVAPSMHVLELLLEMRVSRCHMALVVDEFGGIDGLVTIEDLVEEIVGEIEDEHDRGAEPQMDHRPDGAIDADARLPIGDLEKVLGSFVTPEELDEIDTLGGLIVALAGRVPIRGEVIGHPSGVEFEILDASPRSVRRLRVQDGRTAAGTAPDPRP
jgi:magnesium and cobalt transporter